jgi:hypothetical protein
MGHDLIIYAKAIPIDHKVIFQNNNCFYTIAAWKVLRHRDPWTKAPGNRVTQNICV